MIDILDTNSLRHKLAEELAVSSSVILLSAYITKVGVDWLLGLLPENTRLTVVGRFLPRDLKSGASDITAIRTLLDYGCTVKALSSLHAKIVIIDDEEVFLGSANYTGRGLGLVDSSNLEASVNFKLNNNSRGFICNIISESLCVDFDVLRKFEEYIDKLEDFDSDASAKEWPLVFFSNIDSLFTKDFPVEPLGVYNDFYNNFQESDFSRIYYLKDNRELSKLIFKSSKVYLWIVSVLSKDEFCEGVSFGKLSSCIHDVLLDDPAPYRKTVKDLQSNLYSYLKEYADDIIEFYTPGARSEFIKLR